MTRGFILLTMGVALFGLAPGEARAETLEEVTTKLDKVMAEWKQLRGLGIEVESIEALVRCWRQADERLWTYGGMRSRRTGRRLRL